MKKIIIVLVFVLFLCGCEQKKNVEGMRREEIARNVAQAILDRDFKTAYSYMDSELSDKLSEKRLADGLDQVLNGLTKTENGIYEVKEKEDLWYVLVDYEPKDIRFAIGINNEKRVTSLYLNHGRESLTVIDDECFAEQEFLVGEHDLTGILTMPKDVENPDVVLLIQGSGQSNYNEEIGPNKPFEDIAHGLAKQGIASLRYSKRFYEYPEKATKSYGLDDEYFDDIEAAIEQLKSTTSGNIYYLGHSQGGMFAHYLASEHSEIKGVILMASTPRHLIDVMVDQNVAELKRQGYSDAQVEKMMGQLTQAKELIMNIKEEDDGPAILGIPREYWKDITDTLAPNYMEQSIPTLVLQGDKDFQVYPDVDFPMWKELLKENGEYHLYPNLNHLMMPNITGTIEDYQVESHVDSKVIYDIVSWVKKH